MREEIKSFIYKNGMPATSKRFGLSPFKIRQIVPWTQQDRKDWSARQRIKLREARKKRKWEREQLRRANPEIRKRMNYVHRLHCRRRVFWNLAKQSKSNPRHKRTENITPQELFSIAKKQRLICPYTGLKLTRETMSVEHVVPLSRGGSNLKDNIRLVHVWANRMKLNFTLDEFKEMISRIHATLNSSNDGLTQL